jgi:mono/diheme cytochrome c family protein
MKRFAYATLLPFLTASLPVLAQRAPDGQAIFDRHCVHCHGASGEAPGALQLARTRGADKALLAERDDLAAEYIALVVRHGLKAMPAFVPSDLTADELEALTRYLTQ